MSNEILDGFGEKLVTQTLDRYYKWISIEINEGLKGVRLPSDVLSAVFFSHHELTAERASPLWWDFCTAP